MVNAIQKIILSFALSLFFPATYAQSLEKCSQGELKVGLKQVGTATYYAQNCQQVWQGQTMQIDFHYTQNIPEWAFKRAATHFLKKNINNFSEQSALNQITNLYRAVQSGDIYRLKYSHQNQNLTLLLNNQTLGRVQDPQIQQYFTIWFGKTPFSAKLKQQLLN